MKVLIVLCLGLIAVQALPVKDVFDDIVRDLAELNRMATEEETKAIDTLGGELRSLHQLSQENLEKLGEDLVRDSGILEEQVHDLEREAREQRVDISECIGDRLEQITKLPEHQLGEAGICANEANRQAEEAVNEGFRRITSEVDPIEGYFRQLERCKESDPRDQEVCVAALIIEVQNDQIQIPSKIRLVVEEVLGHLEAEKPTLLLCVAGRVERLNEEGRELIGQITDCAEHLLPPRTQSIKASPALKDIWEDIVRDLAELNRVATEEQTRAIDTLGGELRSLDELSQENIKQLGEDLVSDSAILEEQVHDLEREAQRQRVDISECIGDRLEQISKLPEQHIGEAGICANEAHRQAEEAVNEGFRRITSEVDPIEGYFRQLERCRESDPRDQQVCIAALLIEVQNDQIQIPSKIRLVVEEVLGHLEAEKPTLLLCVAGRVERLNEEGREIVGRITECAERLLPPRKQSIKASPALKDIWEDIVRDLAELNRMATEEQTRAIDTLGGELRSLDELSQENIKRLAEDLLRDSGILEEQVHDLEREAQRQRVDISECIGDRLEQITKLPERHLGEAGICANEAHRQAEEAVNEGFRRITSEVDPIEGYFRQLERCRESDPRDQQVCIAALLIEVQNDQIQIPSKIRLIVEEVLGHLEAEKPTLLLCVAGRVERLNEEGREIVGRITECAERLLPPRKQSIKASPALKDIWEDIVRDLAELNRMATEEQTRAIDTLGGELRSLDELSQENIKRLAEDLLRDSGILEEQVHDLEREAQRQRVDISECIGDRLEQITKLPERHLGEAGICANEAHRQAEEAVNEGFRRITSEVDPIEGYFRQLERCRESDPRDQEVCIAALLIEVQNDQIQIPSKIRLVVEEVLGHLEAEKPTLLLCVAGRVERLNEEGRELVGQITDCAERLLPPTTPRSIKASPALKDVWDDILQHLAELNRMATEEQIRAIDTLADELTSLHELSQQLIRNLEVDLVRDSRILEDQVHDLEREAQRQRVDISECIGDRLKQITKLPERHIGEAGICASMAHQQAEAAVNQGVRRIFSEVDPVEEYFRQVERCRERDPRDQEVCIAALLIEIQNYQIQIPSKIRLVVEEVLGHLEAEKPTLLLCVAGRVERLNEEGRELVGQITDCAERIIF